MPNLIKHSTNSETLALKKGNFYIGTGDVDKGPTSETGYYNGITPPNGGYTIYLNKESNGPSIYVANNDTEFINLTNSISNESYETVSQCLTYFNGQSDKMVVNKEYSEISTLTLEAFFDASNVMSYPGYGNIWYDISGKNNNATLYNSPTFVDGSILFDGINNYATFNHLAGMNLTVVAVVKTHGTTFAPYTPIVFSDTINVGYQLYGFNTTIGGIGFTAGIGNQYGIFDILSNYQQERNMNEFNMFATTFDLYHELQENGVWRSQTKLYFNDYGQSVRTGHQGQTGIIRTSTSSSTITSNIARSNYRNGSPLYSNIYVKSLSIYSRKLEDNEIYKHSYSFPGPSLTPTPTISVTPTPTPSYNSAPPPPQIPTSNLQVWLDASNSSSYDGNGSTWYDISGNDNHVTLNNSPSWDGTYINFDGTNENSFYSYDATPQMTIITIAKTTESNWNNYAIIGSSRANNGWILHTSPGSRRVNNYLSNSSGGNNYLGDTQPNNITIKHLYALTTNGSNSHKGYLDYGQQTFSSSSNIARGNTLNNTAYLGSDSSSFNTRYGIVDIQAHIVYNRELTQSEIQTIGELYLGPLPSQTPTPTNTPTISITPTITPTNTPTMTPGATPYVFMENQLLGWPVSFNGVYDYINSPYSRYTFGFNSVDDGYIINPINMGFSISMGNTTSSDLYVGSNGYLTIGNGQGSIGYNVNDIENLFVTNTGDGYMNLGVTLSNGDIGNLYYQVSSDNIGNYVKIIAIMSAYGQTITPYSWLAEIYQDGFYTWFVTRIESDALNSSSNVGPSSSTNVGQQISTNSQVWRVQNGTNNWTYMGFGSVVNPNVPTPTPTATPTNTPTISVTPTMTPTISVTPTMTPTITVTPSITPSVGSFPIPQTNLQTFLDGSTYGGSGTVWADRSVNGKNGTLVNSPTYELINSGIFSFDGVNDYVSLPPNLLVPTSNNPFTLSIWFKTTSDGILLGQQNSSTPTTASGYVPAMYVGNDGYLRTTCFWGGNTSNFSISPTTVNDNTWKNITVTWQSGTQRSYLNGSLYATLSKNQASYSGTYYYFLGSGTWGGSWAQTIGSAYFEGKIAAFYYYSSALSDSEVLSNYNALSGRYI